MSQYYARAELEELGFAAIGQNVSVHRGSNIVLPQNIEIGSNVRIDGFCTIVGSGPITIGNHVHIAPYCLLAGRGGISFADFSGLSSGVRVYSTSDDYSGEWLTNPTVPEKHSGVTVAAVRLDKHVIVGSNSVVLPGVTIGEGCAVGALSLVNRSLAPWGIYAGSPAIRIRDRAKTVLRREAEMLSANEH